MEFAGKISKLSGTDKHRRAAAKPAACVLLRCVTVLIHPVRERKWGLWERDGKAI